MDYVLITPILNESKYLAKLKETVLSQKVKPLIWVIGDGDSQDGSYETATKLFEGYKWIHVIKQKTFSGQGYSHQNFSNNINDCYEYVKKVCGDNNFNYEYIGKTDATPILADNYFEALLNEMEENPRLVMVCGLEYFKHNSTNSDVQNKHEYDFVKGMNDIKVYRRDFYESLNGYPVEYEPDTLMVIKALKQGWKVKKSDRTYFIKPRRGGTKIGHWSGYELKGRGMYILNYHPALLLLNAVYLSKNYPFIFGMGLIYGYAISLFRNVQQIGDKEIKDYFWNERLNEILHGSLWVCE